MDTLMADLKFNIYFFWPLKQIVHFIAFRDFRSSGMLRSIDL